MRGYQVFVLLRTQQWAVVYVGRGVCFCRRPLLISRARAQLHVREAREARGLHAPRAVLNGGGGVAVNLSQRVVAKRRL